MAEQILLEELAQLFRVLGQPARLHILEVIGEGEACVCHLEAYLGLRQAAISQHLQILRQTGVVTPHRDGRNIFYRLARPGLLEAIEQIAACNGIDVAALRTAVAQPVVPCPCPHCNPDAGNLDCSHLRVIQ